MMLDRKSSAPFDHPLIYRPILKQPATKIMRKRKENECSEAYATQPIQQKTLNNIRQSIGPPFNFVTNGTLTRNYSQAITPCLNTPSSRNSKQRSNQDPNCSIHQHDKSIQQHDKSIHEHDRSIQGSTKRFKRSTSRSFAGVKGNNQRSNTTCEQFCCNDDTCLQQKNLFKRTIDKLREKNKTLTLEKDKMQLQLNMVNEKLKALQNQLQDKTTLIEESHVILHQKDTKLAQIQKALQEKQIQIAKLQINISKLHNKDPKPIQFPGYNPLQASRIINELTNQLKHKEFDAHMLKKIKLEKEVLSRQLAFRKRDNQTLKQRLMYYVKNKNKQYIEESQSDANSSFSLQLSQFSHSPSKKPQDTDRI